MNRYIKYIITIVMVIVVAIVFYNKVYIPKHTYATVTPKKGDLQVKVFGIGNVGARDIYTINPLYSSKILKITTDEGKWVKKGDLLVVMDSVDLPKQLQEAKIGVKKAKLELDASQKDLAALVAQKALSQVTYNRYAKLKEQSFASQSEYDKAKADLDAVNAQIASTKAHIDAAATEVEKAQKSVEALEVRLKHYKLYAPVDGYVVERKSDVGESVLPSQPILSIVDPKTVWIRAYIDEKISGAVKVGQKATITLRSHAGSKLKGYVKRIVAQSDAVTQEREVDVAFEKLPIPFFMNEQAEVDIVTDRLHNVVKIPARLLEYHKAHAGVWVQKDGKAHFQTVKVLGISDNQVAVQGLEVSQKVLEPSKNKKELREGSSVAL